MVLFVGIFMLLQQDGIYQSTLGKISSNYVRLKVDGVTEIQQAKAPYVTLESSRFQNWDAEIYVCLKETMYANDGGCYTLVKGAFFPLFPLIWKLSHLSSLQISLLNNLLFILSLSILVVMIFKSSEKDKLLVFLLLLTLPSTIIYYIPYTESLFLLTMTLAFVGYSQNKYLLYFIACVGMGMLRPASFFIVLALFSVDALCLISHRRIKLFISSISKKTIPFFIGYALAILIQYSYTFSFRTMLDAQKYWEGSIGLINQISDWSLEGFGLNVFSIFFVALPALFFLAYSIIRKPAFLSHYNESTISLENASKYFFLVSISYLSGILVFILLTSGGNLHSFFRFTLTSPPFYIVILYLLNLLLKQKSKIPIYLISVPLLLLIPFLMNTEYGGSRLNFPFLGMYLSLISFAFIYFRNVFGSSLKWTIALTIILLCTIWNTYLLNMFLNEAWIFT